MRDYSADLASVRGSVSRYSHGLGSADHVYSCEKMQAPTAVEDALTPRAGEYRPLTRFQRFRVALYMPLFRLARWRGIIHS